MLVPFRTSLTLPEACCFFFAGTLSKVWDPVAPGSGCSFCHSPPSYRKDLQSSGKETWQPQANS